MTYDYDGNPELTAITVIADEAVKLGVAPKLSQARLRNYGTLVPVLRGVTDTSKWSPSRRSVLFMTLPTVIADWAEISKAIKKYGRYRAVVFASGSLSHRFIDDQLGRKRG